MTIVVDANETEEVAQVTEEVSAGITEEATIEGNTEIVAETAPEESSDSEMPEKYQGKSLEDVIEMHKNVEDVYNRHSVEVSESRKTIDNMQKLIDSLQTPSTEATNQPQESFEDKFYSDPAQAVNSAIENHPELIKAREDRAKQENQLSLNTLEKAYPEWEAKVNDSSFQKWVSDSEIRTEMFKKADSDYRPDYAIELFQMYDAINMIDKTKEVQQQEASKREKALKQTSTETRSSGDSVGGKKIYRRADLINLQVSDPNRYAALADEIQSAYQEGRVK
jgi:hypothetical protein